MELLKTVITVAGCLYLGLIGLAIGGLIVATVATFLSYVWKLITNNQ